MSSVNGSDLFVQKKNGTCMQELKDVQVVVLMGGLGTRLKEFTKECPKPLVDVAGKPFFDYSIDLLIKAGFRKFLFLIGYRAEMIEEYYGDGSRLGIEIQYCYDGEKLLGTGGAVRRAYDYLEDDFLLMYGDSFMDIDYEETVYRYFDGKQRGNRALMTVLRNNNMFDKSNVVMEDGEIILYDKHNPTEEMNSIDYGVCMYEKSLFDEYELDVKFDIAEIQNRLSLNKQITCHEVTKRFYEIGSPESLKEFTEYINYRLNEKHPAVFLDRDGVINEIVYNEDTELMDSPMNVSQFELLPNVAKAIRKIKQKGYYVFIVTNQPAAAKGKTTLTKLYDINTYFVNEMKKEDAIIDGVFMCMHYPKKLKLSKDDYLIKECNCRKPKSGMLEKAFDKYNIDIDNSYMVGDSFTDVQCGRNAKVKTIFLGDYKCDACKRLCDDKPDIICKNVLEAAEKIEKAE